MDQVRVLISDYTIHSAITVGIIVLKWFNHVYKAASKIAHELYNEKVIVLFAGNTHVYRGL